MATLSSYILVGGLNLYIHVCHYLKYNGTVQINQQGDGSGGQHSHYIVIYSVQKKKLAESEGGILSGVYCVM